MPIAHITLDQIMKAEVITRLISTVPAGKARFQQFFGCLPGGPNVTTVGGHHAGWDIFDRTRTIARGRTPGVGPGTVAPQIVGHVSAVIYRSHEKMMLLDEKLFRTRALGRPWGEIDVHGQRYVASQTDFLRQRFLNAREFMLSRMFRGSFQLSIDGDDMTPVDSGGHVTIDFQVPAGNKDQLDMLGDGNILDTKWPTTATADIISHCMQINAANEELHGRPLTHAWMNTNTVQYMLNNTGLKDAAGTANVTFSDWRASPYVSEGMADTGHEIVFRGLPWLRIHVYDAGLVVNGTFTKFIPDDYVIFHCDPSGEWCEGLEGSEPVRENVLATATEQFGLHAHTEPCTQPSGFELISVDNWLPGLYIPKCVQYAHVNF